MWETIAVLIIIIVILIISLVYASRASTQLQSVKDYDKDVQLSKASSYLIWISVVGWLAVILLLGGIIAAFSFGGEAEVGAVAAEGEGAALFGGMGGQLGQTVTKTANYALYGVLIIVGILTFAVGVISALAATNISESKLYKSGVTGPVNTAYEYSVIAAVAAIVSVVLIIIAYAVAGYYGRSTPPAPPMQQPYYIQQSYIPPPYMQQPYMQRPPIYQQQYRPNLYQRPMYSPYPSGMRRTR